MLAAFAPFLLFAAFLLLLLVSLSVPIIKAIYLFHLVAHPSSSLPGISASGSAWFGVWGYCVSPVDVSVVGTNVGTSAQCSKTMLGYDLNSTILAALQVSGVILSSGAISRAISAVLVLHPIACGITFLALVASFFIIRRRSDGEISRGASLITVIVGLLAALLATVVFVVDVVFVAVVRDRVKGESDGVLALNWGNAVWMVLGAALALWLALVGVCAGFCCRRRYQRANKY